MERQQQNAEEQADYEDQGRCPCGRMTANDCAGECGVLESVEDVNRRFNTLVRGNLSGWVTGRW